MEMMMNCDGMMGSPIMMIGMGVFWIGLLILLTLGIFALVKYLKS